MERDHANTALVIEESDDDEIIVGVLGEVPSSDRVKYVEPRDGYCLEVTFADGSSRHVDMGPEILRGKGYARLANLEYFRQARYDPDIGTAAWPMGEDVAPEFLRWGEHLDENCPCGH